MSESTLEGDQQMKCAIYAVVALLTLIVLAAGCMHGSWNQVQGSGVSKTETRTVDAFHAIRLDGAADVTVTIGEQTKVTVTGDDNIVPLIDAKVSGDELVIGSHDSYSTHIGVKIAIVTPSLDAFELNGSGNVSIKGLSGDTFAARIRGSGDLTAEGTVNSVKGSIAGSGDLKLGDLKAKSADVSIAGSGDATVNAEDSIAASIAGSGDIRYKGNPSKVQSSVAGSGGVHKI
jgi:hypothetical protein